MKQNPRITKVYTIYDKISGLYTRPQIHMNDELATRWFKKLIHEPNSEPTDYELYCLGNWDDTTAKIILHEKPEFISKGEPLNHVKELQ